MTRSQAAQRIEALEARIDRLAEILQDFVARCPEYVPPPADDYPLAEDDPLPPNGRAIIEPDKEQPPDRP